MIKKKNLWGSIPKNHRDSPFFYEQDKYRKCRWCSKDANTLKTSRAVKKHELHCQAKSNFNQVE